jgi:hypothetical protein
VHVNVDVQNALLVSQKLDNAEDDVCEISWVGADTGAY